MDQERKICKRELQEMSDTELKKAAERQTAQIIKRELDRRNYEEIAWLKAFKKAKGNETEARALYVEIRESDLLGEVYISLKDKVDQRIAEVEWYRNEQNKIKQKKSEAKKESSLTNHEKQQIKNKYLKSVESDVSIKPNHSEESFVDRFIEGKIPLVISYWVVGVIVPLIIYVIASVVDPDIEAIIMVLLVIYSFFSFIGIWKSAGNYIRENDPPFWGYTARVMMIVGILISIGNLISGR
jgi:hypothetical protein